MKIRNRFLLSILGLIALTSLFSCGVDRWEEYRDQTGQDLWIDSLMRQDYLWYQDIPSSQELTPSYFLTPPEFFKKILSTKDKGYSRIDTLDNESALSYGLDYTLYKIADNDTAYNAQISYIATGSPAANAGLERGEWIMMVNGDYLTKRNEGLLLKGDARQLLIGQYQITQDAEGEEVGVVRSDREVTLDAARTLTDNAVYYNSIYSNGSTVVGYLVYNHFSSGPTANSEEYNNELRNLSRQYQAAGVNEFVLDLRYNSGGSMDCAQLLCTLLTPADRMNSPLALLKYNSKQIGKNRELALNPQLLQSGVNLNLSKIYILTTNLTAAASEMVINCLSPYMQVVLIGSTTAGENVATETFLNPKYPWAVRPVVCEVFNSLNKSDYANGFTPNYSVNELADPEKVLPFGNQQEALLGTALGLITGTISPKATRAMGVPPMELVKSVTICRKSGRGLNLK